MVDEQLDVYDEMIHADVCHGYLTSVATYLKHKPECINKLHEYRDYKWTLLFAACYYEHEAVVQLLVTDFQANVHVEGTISRPYRGDGIELVHGVTPLWTAVAVDNFKIVQFLVEYGLANVNHLTEGRESPLRAACANGNLEMVHYLVQHGADPHQATLTDATHLVLIVFHKHLELLLFFVNTIKCDLNKQDETGQTALHIAVQQNSTEIISVLLSRGALNLRNQSENLTPLVLAALGGYSETVNAFDGYCSDLEWIEAHELLGSAYSVCGWLIQNTDIAMEHFTFAYQVRTMRNIPKLTSDETLEVFNNRRECQTLEELNQLVSLGSREALCFEALLIQKRLLGVASARYHNSICDVIQSMRFRDQYAGCLPLWLYELGLRRQYGIRLDILHLRSIASLCHNMIWHDLSEQFFDFLCQILTVMQQELETMREDTTYDFNLVTLLHLVTISASLLLNADDTTNRQLPINNRRALFRRVQLIVKQKHTSVQSDSTLLHLCCNSNTQITDNMISYPCLHTARLLVFCGIDVDAMDFRGYTALHILVTSPSPHDTLATVNLLCNDANAHLDFANDQGDRPFESCSSTSFVKSTVKRQLRQKQTATPLKCLCSRLVRYSRLPYKEYLSPALVEFVRKH